jgi:hypothetical protein
MNPHGIAGHADNVGPMTTEFDLDLEGGGPHALAC